MEPRQLVIAEYLAAKIGFGTDENEPSKVFSKPFKPGNDPAHSPSPSPEPRAQSPSAAFYEVFSRVEVQNGLSSSSEPPLERKCPKFKILIEFTIPLGLERPF